jgi:hypothetical protein
MIQRLTLISRSPYLERELSRSAPLRDRATLIISCVFAAVLSGQVIEMSASLSLGTKQIGQGKFPPEPRMRAIMHLIHWGQPIRPVMENKVLTVLHSQQIIW